MSRKEHIEQQLIHEYSPSYLQVENESHNHHVPQGSETHFKITMVCARFTELTRIMRHRLVNKLLSAELEQGLHALSMHLYTEQEWKARGESTSHSPVCKDGHGK